VEDVGQLVGAVDQIDRNTAPKTSWPAGRSGSVHTVSAAAPVHTCRPQKSAKWLLLASP
jgi:hypothetical protein